MPNALENTYFCENNIPVYWGDFSIVEATVSLVRQALAAQCHYDRLILLSGMDYPISSTEHIERFFEINRNYEFMNLVEMPCDKLGKPMSRLTDYRFRPNSSRITELARQALTRVGVIPRERNYRSVLKDLTPYAGSQWWALTREACQKICDFVDNDHTIVDFYRNTLCPDEMFFQTILGNSRFRSNIRPNLTYTDWSAGGSSPAIINHEHLKILEKISDPTLTGTPDMPKRLFARKFDDGSKSTVSSLDDIIEKHRHIALQRDHGNGIRAGQS